MKLWMRLLAGGVVGIFLGLYLPTLGGDTADLFRYLSTVVINIGRYAVFPMVLFGLATSTRELREDRMLYRLHGNTILYIIIATAILSVFGVLIVVILSPERVPIVIQEATQLQQPLVSNLILRIFPSNVFSVLFDGSFLLPIVVLAFIIGTTLNSEGLYTSPVSDFFDSASRIFYRINRVIVAGIGIGLVALSAHAVLDLRQLGELDLFRQLFLTVGFSAALVIVAGVPLAVYFWGGRKNPLHFLYGMVAPMLAAFFSSDSYFSLGILTRAGNENLGISRKPGAGVFPVTAVFAKSGTAMVSAISFILVLRSYSSLELTVGQLLWVVVFAFLVSFVLGAVPGSGAIVSLSLLSTLYGRGMEDGYLILQAAGPILVAVGALLDVLVSGAVSYIVTVRLRMKREVPVAEYV